MERIDMLLKNICNGNIYGTQDYYSDKEIEYFYNKYSDLQVINGKCYIVSFVNNKLVLKGV